jgi:membrane protease YdiL (CAAX protease family)
MKSAIIQSLVHFAVLCVFFLFAYTQTKRLPFKAILIFLLLIVLDNIIVMWFPKPSFMNGLSLDWHTKILEAMLALAFIYFYRSISLKEYGMTASIENGSLKPIVVVFIVITVLVNGAQYLQNGFTGHAGTETLLYQATMPGIAQELLYRGAMLGLLNNAFGKSWKLFGASLGWGAVITSVLYGLIHGLSVNNHFEFHLAPSKFLITGLIGFALAWAKERSGSLIPSIVAHNFINLTGSF